MKTIGAGDRVKFTAEATANYLKIGEDVSGVYRVVAATETHLSVERVAGPFPLPGVTTLHASVRRDSVEPEYP